MGGATDLPLPLPEQGGRHGHELRSTGRLTASSIYLLRLLYSKHSFFLIDTGTNVCYNIFSATILGRRLVLLTEDCDL